MLNFSRFFARYIGSVEKRDNFFIGVIFFRNKVCGEIIFKKNSINLSGKFQRRVFRLDNYNVLIEENILEIYRMKTKEKFKMKISDDCKEKLKENLDLMYDLYK